MKRAALLAATAALLAGCGSRTPQPKLPRALAQAWAQQANAIAALLAANNGCGAQTRVATLQQELVAAVNEHRVPQRLLEPLSSGVNDLAAQITCAPPVVPKGNGKGKGHKKHGKGNEGGD
jgi:hypothetical protein